MVNLKKFGIAVSSTALSFSLLASVASAQTPVPGQHDRVFIQVASTEINVTKEDLIKKLKAMFPSKFDFLSNNDFYMNSGIRYPNDETMRYDLSFHKTINGKDVHGYVGFVGEELDIENFYYQSPNQADALFPAKVSKQEASKIATDFLKNFQNGKEYQIDETNSMNYYPSRVLTEPVTYTFSFVRMKNEVPIGDERIEVSVLGNGEVTNFYKMTPKKASYTYDDVKQVKDKNEILAKVKDNLSLELQYQIDYNYENNDRKVHLVYKPTANLHGVQATTGNWQTTSGFSEKYPESTKVEKLSANPLPPRQKGVTLESAKKFAEQFLKVDNEKVKLTIHSVDEMENYNGQTVIGVSYMYEFGTTGHGGHLEIDKDTGDIISFYDSRGELLQQLEEKSDTKKEITKQEALTQAIKYLKELAPSYLHNYAKPVVEPYKEEYNGSYYISFPRVVNGIVVIGDEISVSILPNGTLSHFSVNQQTKIEEWPSPDKVIPVEEAKTIMKDALSLKLYYAQQPTVKENHYYLVYTPSFNNSAFNYLDATTGKWGSTLSDQTFEKVVSHPKAEDELNYLINNKILEVKDIKSFNANASITRGEALKVIMKSLTYYYSYPELENSYQTFTNIDSKHPLYQYVERAVSMGVLKAENGFNPDEALTKQELATWYIRVLGLEQAAKHADIYKNNFADADKIQKEYIGYVAIANSLGLITAENNKFNPETKVSYADLAVSTIILAHEVYNSRVNVDRYY